jgi:hypothetical protein
MLTMHKYPRTQHIEGSRHQPGDEGNANVPFERLSGRFVVVEEKLDGANAGISFDADGKLWLQSRGHFLAGGPREKHFNLFKQWAHSHAHALQPRLQNRFVLYGEWLYAKHTIFYDELPHFFMEFDILDSGTGEFLSTQRRRELLQGLPVVSVPVLWSGHARSMHELLALIGPSLFKSRQWREALDAVCRAKNLSADRIRNETDPSDVMEGLYLKVEEDGRVVERYKYVRADFLTTVLDSGSHWLQRPIVPNQLRQGVNLLGDQVV